MENYHVERVSKENILHLVSLYEKVFRIKVSGDYLQRKYDTSKFGASFIGYICFLDGSIPIAYYGVIPSLVQIDGKKLLAAQSADTMTDPDHQRQGLFVSLATKTYDLARSEGIQFIYGFPNDTSYPGFKKLGWQFQPEQLQLFSVRAQSYLGTYFSKLTSPASKTTDAILGPSEIPVARVFERDSSSGVIHDETFIEYKRYNKTYCVDLDGSRLWLKVDGSLKVGTAILSKDHDARQFIATVRDLARRLHCARIFFITSKSSGLYRFLCTVTEPVNAFPVGFYNLTDKQFDFNKMNFEYADIDSF